MIKYKVILFLLLITVSCVKQEFNFPIPPEAKFFISDSISSVNQDIYFYDSSKNNPTGWLWNFGDGNTSESQNPTHVYTEPGVYTLKFKVYNQMLLDSILKKDFIIIQDDIESSMVKDYEGNTYKTIKIGEQWWMAENLRSTVYNEGEPIMNGVNNNDWYNTSEEPLYCWYNDDKAQYGEKYGALYNWYVIGKGNLCPKGWRVPTKDDWEELKEFLINNGYCYDTNLTYGVAKSISSFSGWSDVSVTYGDIGHNQFNNNSTGFNAMPAGYRNLTSFLKLKEETSWWSANTNGNDAAIRYYLRYNSSILKSNVSPKSLGLSVRCIEGENLLKPFADFEASKTEITIGTEINFNDLSDNSPNTWSWSFGDGATSTLQNPTHTYSVEGIYTVSLTATNELGSDTETKPNFITVTTPGLAPIAKFTVSSTNVEVGENITLTDLSENNPTSWYWDFGDGETSSQQNPTHIYSSEGLYTVSLIVTNEFGSDTETKTDYINIVRPDITGQTGTLTDIDGNVYNWVGIGKQAWMAADLKVTHYPDGSEIPLVTDKNEWAGLGNKGEAYCYYNDINIDYGGLYTYATAIEVCPTGWHLPTEEEWTALKSFISNDGHYGTEGAVLKATSGWNNEGNGTDNYGFSAFPAGYRQADIDGLVNRGFYNFFWSYAGDNATVTFCPVLNYDGQAFGSMNYGIGGFGFSVRCVRDQ